MKSLIITLLFISLNIFSQNGLKLHLGCYKSGDTIPLEELKKINKNMQGNLVKVPKPFRD